MSYLYSEKWHFLTKDTPVEATMTTIEAADEAGDAVEGVEMKPAAKLL